MGVPMSIAPGDESPFLGFSDAVGPGGIWSAPVSSPSLPPPPIDWRQVEGDTKLMCLLVADMERLLHDILASVSWNILRPLWVSLKKERKACLCAPDSLRVLSFPPIFVSPTFVSR
jgi:hypothetical protein